MFHTVRLNHYNASCSCIISVVSYTCCFMSHASCFASHASWPIIMPADSLHASCSIHLISCRMDQGICFIYHVSCLMCHISYLMYYANCLKYFANCSIIRSAVSSITPAVSRIMPAVSFSVAAVPCFAWQPCQCSNTSLVTLDLITWILPNVLFRKRI